MRHRTATGIHFKLQRIGTGQRTGQGGQQPLACPSLGKVWDSQDIEGLGCGQGKERDDLEGPFWPKSFHIFMRSNSNSRFQARFWSPWKWLCSTWGALLPKFPAPRWSLCIHKPKYPRDPRTQHIQEPKSPHQCKIPRKGQFPSYFPSYFSSYFHA